MMVWNVKEFKIFVELGLQAQFEINLNDDIDDNKVVDKSYLCFPVLLRCSSLPGQLSGLYIDLLESNDE